MTDKQLLERYLEMTGQDYKYLMSGEQAFGFQFILDLIKQAISERKKIVWKDEPNKGIGAMSFSLQN
jgi:hypothetical protein